MRPLLLFFCITLMSCMPTTDISEFKFLGTVSFSSAQWSTGDEELRASIIYDFLIKNHPYNSMTIEFVERSLGKPEIYTVNDHILSYIVTKRGERYLISFIPEDAHLKSKIMDVVIEKYPIR